MRALFRILLDHLRLGLVPVDGDTGRRREPLPEAREPDAAAPDRRHVGPREREMEWIPDTALYGPPR